MPPGASHKPQVFASCGPRATWAASGQQGLSSTPSMTQASPLKWAWASWRKRKPARCSTRRLAKFRLSAAAWQQAADVSWEQQGGACHDGSGGPSPALGLGATG